MLQGLVWFASPRCGLETSRPLAHSYSREQIFFAILLRNPMTTPRQSHDRRGCALAAGKMRE
jgi:hypothetical protein